MNCCDLAGEVIKQWGRVPFIPGPQPPPYKVTRSDACIKCFDSSILRREGQIHIVYLISKLTELCEGTAQWLSFEW